MSQTPVTIHLPDALYDRVRQFAEDTNRPLETVLLESVSLLFDDSPESLTVDDL
jgi:predicted transcriptional regulator